MQNMRSDIRDQWIKTCGIRWPTDDLLIFSGLMGVSTLSFSMTRLNELSMIHFFIWKPEPLTWYIHIKSRNVSFNINYAPPPYSFCMNHRLIKWSMQTTLKTNKTKILLRRKWDIYWSLIQQTCYEIFLKQQTLITCVV